MTPLAATPAPGVGASTRPHRADSHDEASGRGGNAAACGHCDTGAPAPTGARARGLATAAAAGLVVVGCALELASVARTWTAPVFLAVALVGGVYPAIRAIRSMRAGRLDINVLMVVAVLGALVIDQWEEAATVVLLFSLAQWLEARSLDGARRAIGRLLDLAPTDVLVRDGDRETRMGIDRVDPGALMIVRPGEKFPLDGIVRDGSSAVNQAPITGESVPVEKSAGDTVYAGTLNGHGALSVVVTKRRDDTTLAHIVHLVETAQAQRAPAQLFIDRFAAWYTPAVIVLAVLLATLPVAAGRSFDVWFYRALVLLVVACPCALVISTPVSIVSALAGAARRGVLIKGGAHLERLSSIRVIAFDKTGTLTTGALRVEEIWPAAGWSADRVIATASAVESRSEHPVAEAILRESQRRLLRVDAALGVRALPGLGVEGLIDGATIVCGAPRLFADRGWLTAEPAAVAADFASRGMSPVVVARGSSVVGIIGMADRARDTAADVVQQLRHEGIARVVMLTGDHEAAAQAIGIRLGLDDVRAALLPQDKVAAVGALRRDHGPVAMIGDGVNDAPALAAADVGIVMGAIGSDAALETADIALMTDDLANLPYVIRLSRATLANIRMNVLLSLALKAAFVVMTVAGLATLWMAVVADTGASLLVVGNALRLRKYER